MARQTKSDAKWRVLRDNLDRLMRARGYKQKSLAKKASLHDTAVRDILTGRSKNPGIERLQAIASVLGVRVEELTGAASPPRSAPSRGFSKEPAAFTEGIPPEAEILAAGLLIRRVHQADVLMSKAGFQRFVDLLVKDARTLANGKVNLAELDRDARKMVAARQPDEPEESGGNASTHSEAEK